MHSETSSNLDKAHSRARAGRLHNHRSRKQVEHPVILSLGLVVAPITGAAASVLEAQPAAADFVNSLNVAVRQARGNSCGALRRDPLVDQTATFVVKTTDTYLNHNARVAPGLVNAKGQLIVNPLPILKDLGSNAARATSLEGAGKTEGDAIKSVLITGFKDIPDCSYTQYGLSALPNNNPDHYFLTALVLAGG